MENISRTLITWLNNVLDANGKVKGTLVCGPNRDGSYTVRLHASGSLFSYKAKEIAIQLRKGGEYVEGESVRSSVFADPTRPCS